MKNVKKIALIVAVVIAALAAVLAVLYFCSRGEPVSIGGEWSPYPYECIKQRRRLQMHLTGYGTEEYRWLAEPGTDGVLTVRERRQTDDEAHFVLKPQESGTARVSFVLAQAADPDDRIFRIDCTFVFDGDRAMTYAEGACTPLNGLVGDADEEVSYEVTQPNAYTLEVTVTGEGPWDCERIGAEAELNGSLERTCTLDEMTDADGRSTHTLTVVAANCEDDGILYIDNGHGKSVELEYHCTSIGEISLVEHHLMAEGEERVEYSDPFGEQYGDLRDALRMTLGVAKTSVTRWRSLSDELVVSPMGVLEYTVDGVAWQLCVSWGAQERDLVGTQTPTGQVTAADATANLYEDDSGVSAVWQLDGLNFMLKSAEADKAACESLTASVIEALRG